MYTRQQRPRATQQGHQASSIGRSHSAAFCAKIQSCVTSPGLRRTCKLQTAQQPVGLKSAASATSAPQHAKPCTHPKYWSSSMPSGSGTSSVLRCLRHGKFFAAWKLTVAMAGWPSSMEAVPSPWSVESEYLRQTIQSRLHARSLALPPGVVSEVNMLLCSNETCIKSPRREQTSVTAFGASPGERPDPG
jgi:hypothetical protein